MMDHTIRAFDTDLQELARNIAEMGRLDGEQIADAIDALFKRDTALAERVIAADDRVDALQRAIEKKAVATIARRQPMAVDLREIVGALRIANDLERVGDLAENIAKRVLLLTEDYRVNEVVLQLEHMVDLVRDQLARVLRSYERRDVALALGVWRKDQESDALNSSPFRELLTYMMEDPRNITFCVTCLFAPRTSSAWATMRPTSPKRSTTWSRAGYFPMSAPRATRPPRPAFPT